MKRSARMANAVQWLNGFLCIVWYINAYIHFCLELIEHTYILECHALKYALKLLTVSLRRPEKILINRMFLSITLYITKPFPF